MTIAESYRQYQQGKIDKAQFMQRARADRQLKNIVTNVMSFDDTVKALRNKNIISEANTFNIIPAEVRKGVNFELGLTYEPIPNWINSFENQKAVEKATKKVMKNLEKDSLYYTKLIATGVKPTKPEPESEVEFKEANLSDTTNKTKADGYLKKEVKKDEDSNVQTSLSKSEARKGKPEGVEQLKEGVKILKENGGSREVTRESLQTESHLPRLQAMLDKVADEWGKDSDIYSDLEDAIVGWSDRNGELSPKGILAIKNLLSNWDMLGDYEEFLTPAQSDDDIPAIDRMYNSDAWVQAQRDAMGEGIDEASKDPHDKAKVMKVDGKFEVYTTQGGEIKTFKTEDEAKKFAADYNSKNEDFRPGVDLGASFEKLKNVMSAEDRFEALMQKYDWYYEMSDDPRYFTAGNKMDNELRSLAKIIGAQKAIEIFNRFAPQDRKATPTFFTEIQKREKVKEIVRKHVEGAVKYTIGKEGSGDEEHEYRKGTDADLEKKLQAAGITFKKKNIG